MKAVTINKFGGPMELAVESIPEPSLDNEEILIKVEYAGIGRWDIFEREGGYDEMLGLHSTFPYVLGSEGSGVVHAIGKNVTGFTVGDKVYASGFLNPKGGFYAEFVAIDHRYVTHIPDSITIREASAVSGVGITALRGIEDVLHLQTGESIMILGASGGIGHISVQIAKHKGARVFAIASGTDGVAVVKSLGADVVVDGRNDDIISAANSFAPMGFDTALFTAGGPLVQSLVHCIRKGGRIAYPNGIFPIPKNTHDRIYLAYNGEPDPQIIKRLQHWIRDGKLHIHVDSTFRPTESQRAHAMLEQHHVGKLCFKF